MAEYLSPRHIGKRMDNGDFDNLAVCSICKAVYATIEAANDHEAGCPQWTARFSGVVAGVQKEVKPNATALDEVAATKPTGDKP